MGRKSKNKNDVLKSGHGKQIAVRFSVNQLKELDAAIEAHNARTARNTLQATFIREIVMAHIRGLPLPQVRDQERRRV